jgi:hypothetical protein
MAGSVTNSGAEWREAWRGLLQDQIKSLADRVDASHETMEKNHREIIEKLAEMKGDVRLNAIRISTIVGGTSAVVVAIVAALLRHWLG